MATPPSFTAGSVLTAAQMNAVGLWLVKTQSIAGTATFLNITDCFTSDYNNYRIIGTNLVSSSGYEGLRFRLLNGTTEITSDYFYGINYVTYAGVGGVNFINGGANTYISLGNINTVATTTSSLAFDILRPREAAKTSYHGQMQGSDAAWNGGGLHNVATGYTGIRFYLPTGNLTGTFSVFGYNK